MIDAPAEVPPITPPRAQQTSQFPLHGRAVIGPRQARLIAAAQPRRRRLRQRFDERRIIGLFRVERVEHLHRFQLRPPPVVVAAIVARAIGQFAGGRNDDQASFFAARQLQKAIADGIGQAAAADDYQGAGNGLLRRAQRRRLDLRLG